MSEGKPRAFEMALEIGASPEQVWKALSEAGEYVRWFPPEAQVVPGAGGSIRWSWGGGWTWDLRVTDWEPGRRLRAVQQRQRPFDIAGREQGGVAPVELAVEFLIEGTGGGTRLRLVQSGFGPGAEWDDELDGVAGGWNTELRSLKQYLERHAGRDRQLAWVRVTAPVSAEEAWRRLTAPGGFVSEGAVEQLRPGDPYRLKLKSGDAFSGVTGFVRPQRDFCGPTEGWNGGFLRLSVDQAAGQSALNVGLSAWGVEPARVSDFEARARAALERVAAVG